MKTITKIICTSIMLLLILAFCIINIAAATEKKITKTRNEVEWQSVKENTEMLNHFFKLNPDSDYDGKYFPNWYGGSLIDSDGKLIVMLTDNSGKEIVNSFVSGAEFLDCQYSYCDLVNTINLINKKIASLDENDAHKNTYIEMSLIDDKNIIEVILSDTDSDAIEWFKTNICSEPYLRFKLLHGQPADDMFYSGNKAKINAIYEASTAFRVKRYTNDGWKYGFITCAHGNDINYSVCDDEYNLVGRIKLRELYGAVDAAYAQMSSSSDYSNVIYGSPYTLNNTE